MEKGCSWQKNNMCKVLAAKVNVVCLLPSGGTDIGRVGKDAGKFGSRVKVAKVCSERPVFLESRRLGELTEATETH